MTDEKIFEQIKQIAGGSVGMKGSKYRWRLRAKINGEVKMVANIMAATPAALLEAVRDYKAMEQLGIQEEIKVKSSLTLGDLIDRYEAELDASDKSPNTVRYEKSLTKQMASLKKIKVTDLSFDQILDWHRNLEAKSGRSVILLSRILDAAGDSFTGSVPGLKNPITVNNKIHKAFAGAPIKKGSRGGQFVSKKTWKKIEQFYLSDKSEATNLVRLKFLIGSGLRTAELRGLMLKDVEKRGDIYYVTVHRQADSKGAIREFTKTAAGRRTLPLLDTAVEAYLERKAELADLELTAPDTILFGHNDGKTTLGDTAIYQNLKRACKAIGITTVQPHSLRGTWGSWFLELNPQIPLHIFCTYGGWESFETARKHYLSWHPDSNAAEINTKLRSALGS